MIEIVCVLGGIIVCFVVMELVNSGQFNNLTKQKEREATNVQVLCKWLSLKQKEKGLVKWLKDQGYNTVGIYGCGCLTESFIDELQGSEIKISYILDKDTKVSNKRVNIKSPKEDFEEVDVIVVTNVLDYKDIYIMLREKIGWPIFSIKEILDNISNEK